MTSDSPAKSIMDFWATQSQSMGQSMGEAWMTMQEQATRAMTEGMQALAGSASLPGGFPGAFPGAGAFAPGLGGELGGQPILDLWSAATAMSQELMARLGQSKPTDPPSPQPDALTHLTDPRQWLAGIGGMDDALGRMVEGPRLADLWEVERHYARVMQAWLTVRRAGMEHNVVVLQAWLDAGRRFIEEVGGTAGVEGRAPDTKMAIRLWTEVANRELLETQRGEPYLRTQREMIRASTDLRMAQQALVEHFGKQYGFPTRTELDDVHRTVTELRREMRTLRRALQAATARQPLVSAPAQAIPTQATPTQATTARKPSRSTGAPRQKRDSR